MEKSAGSGHDEMRQDGMALRLTVSTFGALMGIVGIEHGVGEMLQGAIAPPGLVFPSWPDAAFFRIMAGEPALSILPNMLVTGSLAIVFSMFYLIWAVFRVQKAHAGRILMGWAVLMLLFGGGIFPPVLGAVIGAVATRINAPAPRWASGSARQTLRGIWRWSFGLCILAWLALMPGLNLLATCLGVEDPTLTAILALVAMVALAPTFITSLAFQRAPSAGGVEASS
ncbi:MAG: hypothetical protein V1755_12975 [Chloroflexota bacterium]